MAATRFKRYVSGSRASRNWAKTWSNLIRLPPRSGDQQSTRVTPATPMAIMPEASSTAPMESKHDRVVALVGRGCGWAPIPAVALCKSPHGDRGGVEGAIPVALLSGDRQSQAKFREMAGSHWRLVHAQAILVTWHHAHRWKRLSTAVRSKPVVPAHELAKTACPALEENHDEPETGIEKPARWLGPGLDSAN